MNKIKIKNGPADIELEAATIGAQLKFALFVEQEQINGTFLPYSFATTTIVCDVRDQNALAGATTVAFTATPRALEPGWVDFIITGAQTTSLGEGDWETSVKVFPTGQPTLGDILANVKFPLRWGATH